MIVASDPRNAILGSPGFQYYFNPGAVREPNGLEISGAPKPPAPSIT